MAGANSPSLAPHFHHEAQVTAVLSDSWWFEIGCQTYQIPKGCFTIIPARTPHRSVGKAGKSTVSRDIFIRPAVFEDIARCLVFGRLPSVAFGDGDAFVELILRAVRLQNFQRKPVLLSPSIPNEIF